MKKKGQRTFNNENVHKIKMLGLTLYPLYSKWLLDIFHQRGKVIDSSHRPLPKAPPQVRQNVSLLRVCLGLKNFLGPRDPKRIGLA